MTDPAVIAPAAVPRPAGPVGDRRRPKLLYLVTEDWYFWSHRLPMARAARDAGFEVAVATRVTAHRDRIEAEGFRVHPLAWRRSDRGAGALAAVGAIARLYRRERPDLLHHVALKPVVLGSLAARLAGGAPPMVNALTGLGYAFTARSPAALALRRGLDLAFRLLIDRPNSLLVLQNPDDLALLERRGLTRRTRAVLVRGSGVDTDHFRPLPAPPAPPVVCALVTRMLTIKGVATAVEAVRLARGHGVDLHLHLAGLPDPDSPAAIPRAHLDAWAAEPGITWLGQVADVRAVWRAAHIAVQPSLGGEGIPKSLLEAAACGRPLVASDVPGCRELALPGITGDRVPPGDPVALAAALTVLARDPDRRRHQGAAARRLVETDLSADAVGRRMAALYRSLPGP